VTPPFKVIIPCRYASTRLPGKSLLDIGGRPLLRHVYEAARGSKAAQVLIATDDPRIEAAARGFGAEVMLTSEQHHSGTDRLAEVVTRMEVADADVIVNVQGDEFGLPSLLIDQVAEALLLRPGRAMATLCEAIISDSEAQDPDNVKVVFDATGRALYFSRAPLPWSAGGAMTRYRHIGLYAYRAGFLRRFGSLLPGALEQSERLEQLRALHHGYEIQVEIARAAAGIGVDTPADLARARELAQTGNVTSRDR
jgi:3-deoxy-manno-octulosonate cytidylyltransferase (CMP-KDO synthetase)